MGLPLIGDIFTGVSDILGKFITDPNQKLAASVELAKLQDGAAARFDSEIMGQIGTNTEEAKSASLFVAGWRPAVGWICATGIGWSFVASPLVGAIAGFFGFKGHMPVVDTGQLMTLITGMLGFGALRTYETVTGVARQSISDPVPVKQNPAPAQASQPAPAAGQPHKGGLFRKIGRLF